MELKEVLAQLSEAVPALPARAATVGDDQQRLVQRIEELRGLVTATRERADELRDQLGEGLGGLEREVTGIRERLGQTWGELETQATDGGARIQDEAAELEQRGQACAQAMDRLGDEVADACAQTSAAEERMRSAIRALGERLEAGQETLAAAAATTAGRAGDVSQAVVAVASDVKRRTDALRSTMTELVEAAQERIARTVETMEAMRAAQSDALDRETGHLQERIHVLQDELDGRVEDGQMMPLGERAEATVAAVAAIGEHLESARGRLLAIREPIESAAGASQEAFDPLPGATQAVQAAADQVGLSWS